MPSDFANIAYSFKPLIDGLVIGNAGVILDDDPGVVLVEDYSWCKAPPKHGYVTLSVRELPPPG